MSAALIAEYTGDALSKCDNIQAALDNPDDGSVLSAHALAEFASLRNILIAARSAAPEPTEDVADSSPVTGEGDESDDEPAGTEAVEEPAE